MSTSSTEPTPPPSGCSYQRDGDTAVVTLKPSLSDVKWDQIESLGSNIEGRLQNDAPKKVVFDISPLKYMGSAMVALVVRWWKTVERAGGKSVVVCRDENVMEVLRLASLDKHWTIRETREEAFAELGARPIGGSTSSSASTDSSSEIAGDGPLAPLVIGGVALPVGIVGAVLFLIGVGSPTLGLGLALGGGLTALVAGVLAAILCSGTRRTAGIAIAVFGALIAGLAIYRLQPADEREDRTEGVINVREGGDDEASPVANDPVAPAVEPNPGDELVTDPSLNSDSAAGTIAAPALEGEPAGDSAGTPDGDSDTSEDASESATGGKSSGELQTVKEIDL